MKIIIDYGYDREGSHYKQQFEVSTENAQTIKKLCEDWTLNEMINEMEKETQWQTKNIK